MRQGLCLLLTVCLTTASPVAAQADDPSASHTLLPGGISDQDFQKLLTERLGEARRMERLKKLLNDLLKNPENLGDIHKDVARMIQEARDRPDFNPDAKEWKDLAEKFKDRAAEKLKGEKIDGNEIKKLIPQLDKPPDKPEGAGPPMGDNPPNQDRPMPPAPPPPAPEAPAEEEGQSRDSWFRDLLGKLRSSAGGAGMRNWLRDTLGRDGGLGRLTRGLGLDLRGLGTRLVPRNLRLGKLFGGRPKVSLPRVGGVSAPSISGPSAGSLGKGLMLGVALLAAGVLVWVVLSMMGRGKDGETDGWRLGPWPVDPRSVRTRSDLVKAFEHLALLLLGKGAATANHVDLGGRLANDQGVRQEAAAELAELYEQARYAPPQERLTDVELDRARRDLCLLAGVESA